MRINCWKTALSACLICVVTGWGAISAAEVKDGNAVTAGQQNPPPEAKPQQEQANPMTEHVEQLLMQIRQQDPQKADELVRLREQDPAKFKMELGQYLREHQMSRMREQWRERGDDQDGPRPGMAPGEQPRMGRGGPEMMREWMKEKNEEYIKWLENNYPDDASKLKQLKDEGPEQYMRAVMASGRKYWPIFQASKDNPKLATALKEHLALKEKRMDLLKQIKATTDEKQKKELVGQLEQVVSQQFDVIVRLKQISYEDLTKRLEDLKKEVDAKKAEVEKWKSKDYKSQKVKERINELLNDSERFEWE
jgi:hypothetical protein